MLRPCLHLFRAHQPAHGEIDIPTFALQWFAQMQAGKIDRTQYTAAYGAQLTDAAVQVPKEGKSGALGERDV